jgi:release factor glutamine methyltransferase
MNLGEALSQGKQILSRAGTPSPHLNAEVLMQRLLGVEKVYLLSHSETPLKLEEENLYWMWVGRRANGEPAQYITGRQEFWDLEFEVTSDVLIPRPETEHVVETVLELNRTAAPKIVDVGTGSGCIAVALAKEIPEAHVIAIDRSHEALQVAARNAERLGVCSRIEFLCGDLLLPLDLEKHGNSFDFVVSNPPYIPTAEKTNLPREVRDHEPPGALYSSENDPMAVCRRLIDQSTSRLRSGGYLVVEIGFGQKERMESELRGPSWGKVRFVNDLQSIPRVAVASRL